MKGTAARAAPLSAEALAPYALWTLLAAGLGELVLFRALSRVGVHIPKEGVVIDLYDALVRLGSFAFDVSTVVVFLAVGLLAYALLRRPATPHLLLATVPPLLFFATLSLILDLTEEGPSVKLAYGVLSAAIMILIALHAWQERQREPARSLAVGLVVLAYLAAQYQLLAYQGYRALDIGAQPPGTTRALELAELLVLANAFLLFWAWSGVRAGLRWRPWWPQVVVGGLLIVVFLGAYRGEESSTAAILSLWTLGLTLYLPLPLYALALGLYGATVLACLGNARREPRRLWDAVALGLLPVAGLTLELTYQHLVALVALLLLAGAHPQAHREPFGEAEALTGRVAPTIIAGSRDL